MRLLIAFFRLIRWLNIMFIAITQLLFQYCVIIPILEQAGLPVVISTGQFILLMFSSVVIAAAGYIINDYFDLNIDLINKPDKLVVEKVIKRRWAIVWHMSLSLLGIAISAYLSWKTRAWWLVIANTGCVFALWFYSTTFKKKMLSGNVIISLLTAWVILVIGFLTHYRMISQPDLYTAANASKILRMTFLYAGFAFIISLVREVIKDIEDMPGDERYGCRTLPVVYGINAAKVFTASWLIVLIAVLLIILAYVLPFHWWWPSLYSLVLIIIPLIYILRKLFPASTTGDYHRLSNYLKLVMLFGILSMVFFLFYN